MNQPLDMIRSLNLGGYFMELSKDLRPRNYLTTQAEFDSHMIGIDAPHVRNMGKCCLIVVLLLDEGWMCAFRQSEHLISLSKNRGDEGVMNLESAKEVLEAGIAKERRRNPGLAPGAAISLRMLFEQPNGKLPADAVSFIRAGCSPAQAYLYHTKGLTLKEVEDMLKLPTDWVDEVLEVEADD